VLHLLTKSDAAKMKVSSDESLVESGLSSLLDLLIVVEFLRVNLHSEPKLVRGMLVYPEVLNPVIENRMSAWDVIFDRTDRGDRGLVKIRNTIDDTL
jgi:hypothetical protein